jgi:uncharacterized protein (TIGR03382 family)
MRLDGLSPDGSRNEMANTNVRKRLIVVHEASYVDDSSTAKSGRSNGCLALDPAIEAGVVDRIHDGTLIYAARKPLETPVGRVACGNATCDPGEDATSCAADCDVAGPTCGDATCDASEDATSCPTDCECAADDDAEACKTPDDVGCSTSPGAGGFLALALFGLRRRRNRRT